MGRPGGGMKGKRLHSWGGGGGGGGVWSVRLRLTLQMCGARFNPRSRQRRAKSRAPPHSADRRRSNLQLPIEVCEMIIDIVAEDISKHKPCNLVSCALTCRAWLPRSQFHLITSWRTIDSAKSLSCYRRTVREHGNLAPRVRELTIEPSSSPPDSSWLNCLPRQLAPLLPRLNRITFSGDFDSTFIPHPTFYQSLSLFRALAELDCADSPLQPFRFICTLPNLRMLRVSDRNFGPRRGTDGGHFLLQLPLPQKLCLTHLTFVHTSDSGYGGSILARGLRSTPSVLSLNDLRIERLDARIHQDAARQWGHLVRACSNLQTLVLRNLAGYSIDAFDLNANPHLHVLEIATNYDAVDTVSLELAKLLQSVSSTELERITLDFTIYETNAARRVDDALSGPQFERLRHLILNSKDDLAYVPSLSTSSRDVSFGRAGGNDVQWGDRLTLRDPYHSNDLFPCWHCGNALPVMTLDSDSSDSDTDSYSD